MIEEKRRIDKVLQKIWELKLASDELVPEMLGGITINYEGMSIMKQHAHFLREMSGNNFCPLNNEFKLSYFGIKIQGSLDE